MQALLTPWYVSHLPGFTRFCGSVGKMDFFFFWIRPGEHLFLFQIQSHEIQIKSHDPKSGHMILSWLI